MRSLETRIERLESTIRLPDDDVLTWIVSSPSWCSAGGHELPEGYLRGYRVYDYGDVKRRPGEAEEALLERAKSIAIENRGPRGAVSLIEEREKVPCTECSGAATV